MCAFVVAVTVPSRSVALCSVSTGFYGYPLDEAAQIAVDTVFDYLLSSSTANADKSEQKNDHDGISSSKHRGDDIDLVVFCVFDRATEIKYIEAILKYRMQDRN